jgi:uncharacterized membrane protein
MNITDYFLLFIIYANLGWLMEMIVTNIPKKKIVNRGFLIGPICPIYGYGCLAIILLLHRFTSNLFILFFMSILICCFLEYTTSYMMEKLFNARWWDYSQRKWNLNGRICANTMIPFGILGCFMMYVLNPFVTNTLLRIPSKIRLILAMIIFLIYVIDSIISFIIMVSIRGTIKKISLDNTEEITNKVKEALKDRFLYRRLMNAFPNVKAILKEVKKKIKM